MIRVKLYSLKSEFKIVYKFFCNNLFAYILLYLQTFLINKYLSVNDLGHFSYIQSILTLLVSIYSMEVYSTYLRFIGFNDEKDLVLLVRKVLILASALFCITIFIYFKNPFYILFCASMWMRERIYFFRAKLEIKTYGRIKILQYLLSIIFIIILKTYNLLNDETTILVIGFSYFIISIYYSFPKNKYYDSNDVELTSVKRTEFFKFAIPLSFNAIVVWLLGAADQFLINTYLDKETLAYYSVAFRTINIIRVGTGLIMEYWPRFYFEKMELQEFASVRSMYLFFMCFVALLCVGSIVFSEYIYWLMGASQYCSMKWMFCLLAVAELFRQWGSISMTFQSFMNNTYINILCLSILSLLKLIVNLIFIETFNVNILFYSTLACYCIYFICSLYFGNYYEYKFIKYNSNIS